MRAATSTVLLSALLQMSGCIPLYTAARTEIPSSWAIDDKRLPNGCPVVDGVYENIGETAPANDDPYRAGHADVAEQLCLANGNICRQKQYYIGIYQPTQDGSVLIYNPTSDPTQKTDTATEPITLTIKRDFECRNGFIIFSNTKRSWGEMSDYNISTHTVELSRLKSGDLFMKSAHTDSGFMLFFMGQSVDEKKFRFKSIKAADQ